MILGVLFNSTLDTVYKCGEFFKTLLEKSFEFILDNKVGTVLFF